VRDPGQFSRDLAAAIERVARDGADRERWGRAALDRVEEVGSWDRRVERMEEVYGIALGERNP
jgi:glycosyltransferase involved in cell wall biosynthesis